ncbi:hypothetical protein BAUCODRAFT_124950 [Baudoinia panamericana UAMH 10762]|uniref:Uncharacterized protein n=1 Tax=Baudoinia panamericana (strain UAMH 10762) TaxID=717646 RepID=M2MCI0_BAUPA|nr:uncharacterized protein BAUCODRAFT_124950 [Baudoinia panamericana UAMH 10762]EMC94231.1 hypothetical protein BAUCODRAFT_124950 [Baudoinia panamericana UAMH 10762]
MTPCDRLGSADRQAGGKKLSAKLKAAKINDIYRYYAGGPTTTPCVCETLNFDALRTLSTLLRRRRYHHPACGIKQSMLYCLLTANISPSPSDHHVLVNQYAQHVSMVWSLHLSDDNVGHVTRDS